MFRVQGSSFEAGKDTPNRDLSEGWLLSKTKDYFELP